MYHAQLAISSPALLNNPLAPFKIVISGWGYKDLCLDNFYTVAMVVGNSHPGNIIHPAETSPEIGNSVADNPWDPTKLYLQKNT